MTGATALRRRARSLLRAGQEALICRWSTTATTPFTPAATSLALAFDAAESTEPVNVTVAFLVSTSIVCERSAGSPCSAVLTCCVRAASSAGAAACPLGVVAVFGAAVGLFAAIDGVSAPVEGAPLEAVLGEALEVLESAPEVDALEDGLEPGMYDELGAGESVERDNVSVDVLVDAVPGLRWSHAASEVAAATAVIAVNAERVLAFILLSFSNGKNGIATSVRPDDAFLPSGGQAGERRPRSC